MTTTQATIAVSAVSLVRQTASNTTTDAISSLTATNKLCSIGLEGVNIVGRDSGSVRETNKSEGCRARGVANDQCKWYTWTDYEGGTCWFKSGDTLQVEVNGQLGAYSAFVRYMDVCPKVSFLHEAIDYFGGDIGDALGANPEECDDIVNEWPDCEVFVWCCSRTTRRGYSIFASPAEPRHGNAHG